MISFIQLGNQTALKVENGRIVSPWSNFAGNKDNFGNSKRNFTLLIDDEAQAQELVSQGLNVRVQNNVEEGATPEYYLKVYVQYHDDPSKKRYDPKIHLVSGNSQVDLDEQSVACLDSMTFDNVDLIITSYRWEVGPNSGISAYLNEGYFVQHLDVFADKYMNMNA